MIPLFRPSLQRKEMDAVLTCLVADTLQAGQINRELCREASTYLGVRKATAFSEYYRALATTLELAGLPEGSGVVISALSPAFYLQALKHAGLTPLVADVDADSACISPEAVGKVLQNAPTPPASLLLHYPLGFVPDLDGLAGYQLFTIDDISQSLGANFGERKCGAGGSWTVLSLDQNAIVTAGGGALVFAGQNRLLPAFDEKIGAFPSNAGFLLPDMNAALGLSQLRKIERFLQKRQEIVGFYSRALMQGRHRSLLQRGEGENVHYSFPVVVDSGLGEVQKYAKKYRVETGLAFADTVAACHPEAGEAPVARSLAHRTLLFPLYPSMTKSDVTTVSKVLTTLP